MSDEQPGSYAPGEDAQPSLLRREPRKPVVAIMGEFSSGKSTFLNVMLGGEILPTQTTATQLPPVWLKKGSDEPHRVDKSGNQHPLDLDEVDGIPVMDTKYLSVSCEADILEICDLMDTPGISDPNIPTSFIDDVFELSDAVIWCTHGTQAWRQSEASMWATAPANIRANSMLMITRGDKLINERDRMKVQRRLEAEAGGVFKSIIMVSLLDVAKGVDDTGLAGVCGRKDLFEAFGNLLRFDQPPQAHQQTAAVQKPLADIPAEERPVAEDIRPKRSVMPRRVRTGSKLPRRG